MTQPATHKDWRDVGKAPKILGRQELTCATSWYKVADALFEVAYDVATHGARHISDLEKIRHAQFFVDYAMEHCTVQAHSGCVEDTLENLSKAFESTLDDMKTLANTPIVDQDDRNRTISGVLGRSVIEAKRTLDDLSECMFGDVIKFNNDMVDQFGDQFGRDDAVYEMFSAESGYFYGRPERR